MKTTDKVIVTAIRRAHGLMVTVFDIATAKDLRIVSRAINDRIKELANEKKERSR